MCRKLRCWLGFCSCKTMHDDTGHWGECIHCGKRFGFVSREKMRLYIDREIAAHKQTQ